MSALFVVLLQSRRLRVGTLIQQVYQELGDGVFASRNWVLFWIKQLYTNLFYPKHICTWNQILSITTRSPGRRHCVTQMLAFPLSNKMLKQTWFCTQLLIYNSLFTISHFTSPTWCLSASLWGCYAAHCNLTFPLYLRSLRIFQFNHLYYHCINLNFVNKST